jgi:ElaB/YqjD/DUF883 family membrane-anchored ribosome-binding protein
MAQRNVAAKTGKSEKSNEIVKEDVEKLAEESQVKKASKTNVKEDPLYKKLEEAGENLKTLLNDVSEKANNLEKKFQNQISQAGDSVKKEIADAEGKIRENPFLAVGIAAGFGILVGLLLNRNK